MSAAARASMRLRVVAFVLVVALCAAGVAGYALHVVRKVQAPAASGAAAPAFARVDALPAAGGAAQARPFVVFRSTALGDSYGRVASTFLDSPDAQRGVGPLACDRVHYAAGSGICLQAHRGAVTTYRGLLFDAHFSTRKTFELAGPPSRARVSPDGRRAAFTVFINGHAYSNPGFTTRTSIVDAIDGTPLVDNLEDWPVTRDGVPYHAADFNFWGVTFAHDANRFFATLGTNGVTHLVEGDLSTKQMRVVADGVECPSLSPDGRRIAFKRRVTDPQGRLVWHLAVLELATGQVRVLDAETRNVDDQVEWNGAGEILYGMPVDSGQASAEMDVWAIAADGATPARRILPFAFSPAVVR